MDWQLVQYERAQQGPGPETTKTVLTGTEVEVRTAYVQTFPNETVRHGVLVDGTMRLMQHYRQMGRR